MVFAWALLGELPGAMQLLGGLLLLCGVIVVRAGEPRACQRPRHSGGRFSANARGPSMASSDVSIWR